MGDTESEFAYNAGTLEPRPSTRRCERCARYVTSKECGASAAEHHEFAAITATLLCRFSRGENEASDD